MPSHLGNEIIDTKNGELPPPIPLKIYAKIIPNINPAITPNVFVLLVKIPTANTPANGTPTRPVINKNKSHRSFESEAIK